MSRSMKGTLVIFILVQLQLIANACFCTLLAGSDNFVMLGLLDLLECLGDLLGVVSVLLRLTILVISDEIRCTVHHSGSRLCRITMAALCKMISGLNISMMTLMHCSIMS